jgi:diaminopimelate decarboxylase
MDRSTPVYLVEQTKTQNTIGEWVTTETLRKVYANVTSVSASEYFSASEIGLNPEVRFTMFAPDYKGETIIEYNGYRYSVYRIYVASTDKMELYAQREAGTA